MIVSIRERGRRTLVSTEGPLPFLGFARSASGKLDQFGAAMDIRDLACPGDRLLVLEPRTRLPVHNVPVRLVRNSRQTPLQILQPRGEFVMSNSSLEQTPFSFSRTKYRPENAYWMATIANLAYEKCP